jgi:hypothetical protein
MTYSSAKQRRQTEQWNLRRETQRLEDEAAIVRLRNSERVAQRVFALAGGRDAFDAITSARRITARDDGFRCAIGDETSRTRISIVERGDVFDLQTTLLKRPRYEIETLETINSVVPSQLLTMLGEMVKRAR